MSLNLIGEIIGVIAIIEGFFIFLSNRRKNILKLKGVSDVLWAANGFLTSSYTGGVLNLVMITREFVFYNRLEKKWAQHILWKYVFMLLCFFSPVVEIIKTGRFDIVPFFPACGSVLAVYGFYCENPKYIRILNFFAGLPWLIYYIFTNNISGTVSGVVGILSIFMGAFLAKIKQKGTH